MESYSTKFHFDKSVFSISYDKNVLNMSYVLCWEMEGDLKKEKAKCLLSENSQFYVYKSDSKGL